MDANPADLASPLDDLPETGLTQQVQRELEAEWQTGRGRLLEDFCACYPRLGRPADLPVSLLYREYLVRHRFGDRPTLDQYRGRFPRQFPQLEKLVRDSMATASLAALPASRAAPPTRPGPTPVLPEGGYTLGRLLGRGSFADVWEGTAPGGIAVAIKVIREALDESAAQRELQALELTKNLKHPFLLQTHAFWVHDNHLHIVMDLAEGNLADRAKACKRAGLEGIPRDELLGYLREAAEAIDFLHANRVLHRDIKPANILLLHGHVKVADFGLARAGSATDSQSLMASGSGTPLYMGPEVWQARISAQSDQYSLAVTYVEVRTGHQVLRGANLFELMNRHMDGDLDLGGLPAEELVAVRRALHRDPHRRFPNCASFVRALEEGMVTGRTSDNPRDATTDLDGRPTPRPQAYRDPTDYHAEPVTLPGPRPRWPLAVAAVGFLLALTLGMAWGLRPAEDPEPTAVVLPATAPRPVESAPASAPRPPAAATAPAEVPYLPPGWQKAADAVVAPGRFHGKLAYTKVVQERAGEKVVYCFVPKIGEGQPESFYALETKVWNGLFRQFARAHPELIGRDKDGKGLWEMGARENKQDGPQSFLGVKDRDRYPVFNLTCAEADACARWLGGQLPTRKQWDRAAGCYAGGRGPILPVTPARDPTPDEVAYHRAGPMPVGTAPRDVSPFGCRDMAGNGLEWTRDVVEPGSTVLPVGDRYRRGCLFWNEQPLQFQDLEQYFQESNAEKPSVPNYDTSFRVVLENWPGKE